MTVLAKFEKQPNEVQDFDIDFSEYLTGLSDYGISKVVTADIGLTILASTLLFSGTVVKVFTSGGTDGVTYKITVTLTTNGGRVKQAEIKVKVKEY
jgi:hypothetical protein